jgi:hypothetical protein
MIKNHSDLGVAKKHKVYYVGEGGGFPPNLGRGESYESRVAHGLL